MHPATDILQREHRIIESVLSSLVAFAGDVRPEDREEVRRFAEFFSQFADRCHHGKEEDLLFQRMRDFGFPADSGPIAVMLSEHVEGRSHVRALREIGAGAGPLAREEIAAIKEHTQMYVPLLANHIVKEDRILYPMALRALPSEVLDRLVEEYDAFEHSVMGEGEHERFHALAAQLIEAHAGVEDVSSMGCVGCG